MEITKEQAWRLLETIGDAMSEGLGSVQYETVAALFEFVGKPPEFDWIEHQAYINRQPPGDV